MGRRAGATAVLIYGQLNTKEAFVKAAQTADDMVGKLPAGEFITEVGEQALYNWERQSEWAKATVSANLQLRKGVPADKERQAELYRRTGDQDRSRPH